MLIGVGKLILDFYNNESISKKRRGMEDLCASIRKQFNISILEIADFEDLERCVLGFSVVIPDHWKTQTARGFVEKICTTIDETSFARVVIEDWDLHEIETAD